MTFRVWWSIFPQPNVKGSRYAGLQAGINDRLVELSLTLLLGEKWPRLIGHAGGFSHCLVAAVEEHTG